jgi:hypothetical protein
MMKTPSLLSQKALVDGELYQNHKTPSKRKSKRGKNEQPNKIMGRAS